MKCFVIRLAMPIQHWEQGKVPRVRIRCNSTDFILMKKIKGADKVEEAVLIQIHQKF